MNVVSVIGFGRTNPTQDVELPQNVGEGLPPIEIEMPKNALFKQVPRVNEGSGRGGLELQYHVKLEDGRTAVFVHDPGAPEPQPGVWVPLELGFGIIRAFNDRFVFITCRWDTARGYKVRA